MHTYRCMCMYIYIYTHIYIYICTASFVLCVFRRVKDPLSLKNVFAAFEAGGMFAVSFLPEIPLRGFPLQMKSFESQDVCCVVGILYLS